MSNYVIYVGFRYQKPCHSKSLVELQNVMHRASMYYLGISIGYDDLTYLISVSGILHVIDKRGKKIFFSLS
jgi:hypothetical protein